MTQLPPPTTKIVQPKAVANGLATTHLQLALPLDFEDIEALRGAVAASAGLQNELFHNHDNTREGYHYRYPLIQYHCAEGNAAMLGMGDGAEAIAQWMLAYNGQLKMNGKLHQAPIVEYCSHLEPVHSTDEWHTYRIHDWVALNEKNYAEWRRLTRLADQMVLLESAFTAHIMAFARGINWFVDRRLVAELTDYHGCQWHQRRGADLLAFDATFRIQAQLPDGIGLGKGVSIGFGRVKSE